MEIPDRNMVDLASAGYAADIRGEKKITVPLNLKLHNVVVSMVGSSQGGLLSDERVPGV